MKTEDTRKKTPLKAGDFVHIMPFTGVAVSEQEQGINDELASMREEAYTAGFDMDVKAVTGCTTPGGSVRYTVLYRLSADPSFRPPM